MGGELDNQEIENEVLTFWFGDDPEEKRAAWFEKDAAFDTEIVERFASAYEAAASGALDGMASTPLGCLALVIILDQFPRNMFRNDPRSFTTDDKALGLSKDALSKGFDQALNENQRAFLCMPFMHSEGLADQQRSVELFATISEQNLDYARQHLVIVERFGRFPHRNAVLGRRSTDEEIAFLNEPNSSF